MKYKIRKIRCDFLGGYCWVVYKNGKSDLHGTDWQDATDYINREIKEGTK